ncbi:MAG: tetratricopeptide repeat protein [Candidatus Paceibacterota bacterium]
MNGEKPPQNTNKVFSMPKEGSPEYNRRKRKPLNPNETRKQEELLEELFYQGTKLAQENDRQGALKIYERILEIDENHVEALTNIGIIYFDSGDFKKAEEFLGKALKINPENLLTNFDMGSVKGEQGQREEEIKYYLKVIEIDPLYPDVYYNLGLAWRILGKYENAILCYRRYLDLTRYKKDEIDIAIIEGEIERCGDLQKKKTK